MSYDAGIINTDLPIHHSKVTYHQESWKRNGLACGLISIVAAVFFVLMNGHVIFWCFATAKSKLSPNENAVVRCAMLAGLAFAFLMNLLFNRNYLKSGTALIVQAFLMGS